MCCSSVMPRLSLDSSVWNRRAVGDPRACDHSHQLGHSPLRVLPEGRSPAHHHRENPISMLSALSLLSPPPPGWQAHGAGISPGERLRSANAVFCAASKSVHTSESITAFTFPNRFSSFIFKLCSFEKEIKAGNFIKRQIM